MTPEGEFKRGLIKKLKAQYPGAVILKNDANRQQGIPDHIILYGPRWAMFEAKAHERASHRLNQDYYVNILNEMSYASFVYPENEEAFLNELRQTLRTSRRTRLP